MSGPSGRGGWCPEGSSTEVRAMRRIKKTPREVAEYLVLSFVSAGHGGDSKAYWDRG